MNSNNDLYAEIADLRHKCAKLEADKGRISEYLAAAMAQGYVNVAQRETLLFAFKDAIDEPNDLLARVIACVKAKGYRRSKRNIFPLDYRPPYYSGEAYQ